VLYSDNQGDQKLACNPVFHNRAKHIDIHRRIFREAVESKEIILKYCNVPGVLFTMEVYFRSKNSAHYS
jgi:hypothetical protein